MNTAPQVVNPGDLEANHDTPGIARFVAFRPEASVLVEARVEGGVSSGWHHHGDRHVYAHLLEGSAVMEYGQDGRHSVEVVAGGFFHLPPRVVHRDVNPSDVPQRWITSSRQARRGAGSRGWVDLRCD